MPIDRTELVRTYLAGPRVPVTPRDAATVVLLRDGTGGLETFLLHRPGGMSFAGGMYVFPGGAVEASDRGPRAAAVRETYEECGVRLDPDDLLPWARWVTPEFSDKRFDTRFFVAALPHGEHPRADGQESDGHRWVDVRQALADYRADALPMFMVTAATLRDLSRFDSVVELPGAGPDPTPRMLRAVPAGDGFRYVIDVDGVPVDEHDFMSDERSTA